MAKQNGMFGNWTGKLANTVGYRLTNSNNKVTQGVREYRADIKNPRTVAQAAQRMKMYPIVAFYRALSEILDHSFEGVRVGGRSHQKFMKLNLGLKDAFFPYIVKGTQGVFPGDYIVSTGSLRKVYTEDTVINNELNTVRSSIAVTIDLLADTTIGQLSTNIIANNPGINDGDQITFVSFINLGGQGDAVAILRRVVLDASSSVIYGEIEGSGIVNEVDWLRLRVTDGVLQSESGGTIEGATVILSRRPTNATWLLSPAQMVTSDEYKAAYGTTELYQSVIESYRDPEQVVTSDLYLRQAGRNAGEGGYFVERFPKQSGFYVIEDTFTAGNKTITNPVINVTYSADGFTVAIAYNETFIEDASGAGGYSAYVMTGNAIRTSATLYTQNELMAFNPLFVNYLNNRYENDQFENAGYTEALDATPNITGVIN